jgi:myo-inositol-1(or 4)-monophosphatase
MNGEALQERFDFASRLIREAGAAALGYFDRYEELTIKSKGVQDMASEADLDIELLIRNNLRAAFPDDDFLGEETGRGDLKGASGVWVVDPIDGTQPFVSGMGGWCVSIAFVADGVLEMGFVTSPVRRETFVGRRGRGSTLNGRPIRIGHAERLDEGIVGVGYSPRVRPDEFLPMFGRLLRAGAMFYREGSGALTLCSLACGRLIGYVEPHINSWDCLGALAVVEAAGGKVSDFLANDGLWKGNRVIAGPARLFPALEALFEEEGSATPVV